MATREELIRQLVDYGQGAIDHYNQFTPEQRAYWAYIDYINNPGVQKGDYFDYGKYGLTDEEARAVFGDTFAGVPGLEGQMQVRHGMFGGGSLAGSRNDDLGIHGLYIGPTGEEGAWDRAFYGQTPEPTAGALVWNTSGSELGWGTPQGDYDVNVFQSDDGTLWAEVVNPISGESSFMSMGGASESGDLQAKYNKSQADFMVQAETGKDLGVRGSIPGFEEEYPDPMAEGAEEERADTEQQLEDAWASFEGEIDRVRRYAEGEEPSVADAAARAQMSDARRDILWQASMMGGGLAGPQASEAAIRAQSQLGGQLVPQMAAARLQEQAAWQGMLGQMEQNRLALRQQADLARQGRQADMVNALAAINAANQQNRAMYNQQLEQQRSRSVWDDIIAGFGIAGDLVSMGTSISAPFVGPSGADKEKVSPIQTGRTYIA